MADKMTENTEVLEGIKAFLNSIGKHPRLTFDEEQAFSV